MQEDYRDLLLDAFVVTLAAGSPPYLIRDYAQHLADGADNWCDREAILGWVDRLDDAISPLVDD